MRPAIPLALLLSGMLLLLAGCQSPSGSQASHSRLGSPDEIRSALFAQYDEWQGVPYRPGGQSKRGVDCSGFVQLTFRERFGLELPRDTRSQSNVGAPISSRGLQPGDLLFFKTGRRSQHVGIFIQDGRFLHASTSKGVIISDMENPYWQRTYWQSRRLEE
ncbi:MAG: NlpC/P60 family protein [Aeromonadaceae bacterium]